MTTFEHLRDIIADVLNVNKDRVTPFASFVDDLGADSLDHIELLMGAECEFDVDLDEEALDKVRTVQDAVSLIDATRGVAA